MDMLSHTLMQLTFSQNVQQFRNLTVYPLLAENSHDPWYLTLDQALQRNVAQISEVSAQGMVAALELDNRSELPVLLVDGEELAGMKQNRIVNLTILARAQQRQVIPVSCVEQKRWSSTPRWSGVSGHQQYARARARKAEEVSISVVTAGAHHSDQGQIWSDLERKFTTLHGHSQTAAMADLYEQLADRLEPYVRIFHPRPFQVGAVFAINGRIVGMELFDSSQTWRRFLGQLIRSYAMDAVEWESSQDFAPDPAAALAFVKRIGETPKSCHPALGEGKDVRFTGAQISGGALIAGGRMVHLAAFDCAGLGHS